MNIVIIGAAGFIGTNLAIHLKKNKKNKVTLVAKNPDHFVEAVKGDNVNIMRAKLNCEDDFYYTKDQDVLYHLVSTTVPTTSNKNIPMELQENVIFSAKLLDACVKNGITRVVFISSGGTVYGKEGICPLSEETPLKPISSYGLQKVAIENLLYLYHQIYRLDYKIIRLSNPYGPYQRPNGVLGVVTTLTYKALNNEKIEIYGDGSVVRDFIYIDDAIEGIVKIANSEGNEKIYNLGSGKGNSIRNVIETIEKVVGKVEIEYKESRNVDVPINFLDISRFERDFGKIEFLSLEEGVFRTADFIKKDKLGN